MARKKKEPDKLAQEVAQALACGMSYGKWKAMQDPVKIEKKLPEGWKACEWCGKHFKPKTARPQKYCEVNCQRAASKLRHNEYMSVRREKMKEGVC
ncbi:MAG: hypothetical protein IJF02_05055 [Oscillospiraceae bacterium]|nr:hypothetical protein [Oscillospiraceae bacterium]